MNKTKDDILVGVVIAVAIVLAIVGSLWLARGGLSKGYPLYARFAWGAGLKKGSPVWVSGAAVGYVSDVQFRPDGSLLTELRLTTDQPIPRRSPATVVPNGIFGDVAVNFTPLPSGARYVTGDTVVTGPPSPGIAQLTAKADSISASVNSITTALNKELVAGGGIADLRGTLAGTNKLVAQLSVVAAEQSRQLTATMTSLRRATSAVDSAKIDSTLSNLRAASSNVNSMTRSLDSTGRALNQIVAKVDSGNGTAAKLVNDPAVYNDVHSLLGRMDSLLADIKKNPKRYINVKVF
ncbi:MAG TPA: MlaD family protein [Candidatus Elarobacter sp.]|nr:MlaD family protein [Candidatus Elarobacter sp.]